MRRLSLLPFAVLAVAFMAFGCHESTGSEPSAEPMGSGPGMETEGGEATPVAVEIGIPNEHHPAHNLITGGQPTEAELQKAKARGVSWVISLQTEEEPGAKEEAEQVRDLGMAFRRLPVKGAEGVTKANADALDRLLAETGESTVLLHCASGNRTGALLALRAYYYQNMSVPEALAFGKSAGLAGLEPVVRDKLEASCQAQPSRCGPADATAP